MPDSKITALTAITTVNPATFPLVIVDTSDTSMATTGTTKKVTTNQLLGSGGTATLASATITGDLTVDTNTLKVDSANNVVGIGTASPTAIAGYTSLTINTPTTGSFIDLNVAGVNKTRLLGTSINFNIETAGTIPITMMIGGQNQYRVDTAGVFTWYDGAGGTRMTLNSTGLGVGRSPSYRLQASSGTKATTASLATVVGITTTDADDFGIYFRLKTDATGANRYAAITSFDNGSGNGARDLVLQDLGGNVGVGVTPSAWSGSFKAIDIGSGCLVSQPGNQTAGIFANSFANGTNYTRKALGTAAAYDIYNGAHYWLSAASGAAGSTFAFGDAKMTLDASGNLLVGTTAPLGGNAAKFHLSTNSGTTRWAVGPYSDPNSFIISAAGGSGVYLNGTAATSWTSASDERLKDIIEPISNAIAKVGSLRAVIGKFKFDQNNTRKPFLIAQDLQSVLPEAVDASNPDQLGVAYTDVIPLLVAAIKELAARVQTLETR